MARKIIYRENGLTGSNNTPSGYKYLGYDGLVLSEKAGATISAIGGGDYLPLTGGSLSGALTIQGTALYDGFAGFELFSDEPRITLIDSSFAEYRFENGEITILGPLGDIMKMGVTSSNEYIKFDANTSTLQGSSGTNNTWTLPNATGTVALTKNQGYDNFIEVSISSAEILSLSTTPKDVLPVLTGSDYYDYKVIFEYTYGTTPYSNGGGGYFFIVDNFGRELTTMENLDALTYSFASNYPAFGAEQNQPARVRPATGLSCSMAFATTLGDGTVNLKVYYTTHTL